MNNSLQDFEDAYWNSGKQVEAFRHRQALEWLTPDSGPVLDVGCGDGFFLRMLREKGIEGWGVDVSQVAVDVCHKQGLVADVSNFASGFIPERPARTAVILDVLEHLYDPVFVLRSLHGRVDSIIVSVPNFVSLPARIQILRGSVPENNTPRKGHVYWYTQRVLEQRLAESGWRIETQSMNPPWMARPVVGSVIRILAYRRPSLWSLSLVVRAVHI